VRIILQGNKELEKKLLELDSKVAKKIVRQAVRDAAQIMQKEIQQNARSFVGGKMGSLMAQNTVVRAFKKQRKGAYGVSTKFSADVPEFVGNTAEGKRYFIPVAIEYGHATPGLGGTGDKTVPAIPFVRTAFDMKQDECLKVIENEVEEGIESVWGK
jgi:HK97 gp10 family phage protein